MHTAIRLLWVLGLWATSLGMKAQGVQEEFASDPVLGGRFIQATQGTESNFRFDAGRQALRAILDVDQDPAYYLSLPFEALTDQADASFSVRFSVEEMDDREKPATFVGLLTQEHVEHFGDGLTLVVSVAGGQPVANANLDAQEFRASGSTVSLRPQREYLAVGRYRTRVRQFVLEVFDGAGFTNLVGFSAVDLPESRHFSVDRLGLQNAGGRDIDQQAGSLTLLVDDLFTPAAKANVVTVDNASIQEGNEGVRQLTFPAHLRPASSQRIEVDYTTADGSASAGSDYVARAGTIVFLPGISDATVAVDIVGDRVHETNETVFLNLRPPPEAALVSTQAVGTIIDDDPKPLVNIESNSVVEGHAGVREMVFPVLLSAASGLEVRVRFVTGVDGFDPPAGNGLATPGTDFRIRSGELVFLPGQTSNSVAVEILADVLAEPDESFRVLLSEPVNADLGQRAATGTIVDDDQTPLIDVADTSTIEGNPGDSREAVFIVRLTQASGLNVQVGYAVANGTATVGVDLKAVSGVLSFPAGVLESSVRVPILGDNLPEADETFTLLLSNPVNARFARSRATATIIDDDPPAEVTVGNVAVMEGDSGLTRVEVPVRLTGTNLQTVSFRYATADGTALGNVDYVSTSGYLVIPPPVTQTNIEVFVVGDRLNETDKTFVVNLSEMTNGVCAKPQAVLTIRDDDLLPQASIRAAVTNIIEGNTGTTNAFFSVTLSAPSGQTVSIGYATRDGSARSGADYTARFGTLFFSGGVTQQTVIVPIVGDLEDEENENFFVELSSAVNALVDLNKAEMWIEDDDGPPSVTLADVTVKEGDTGTTPAGFGLTLARPSGRSITIDYATGDVTARAGVDYQARSGSIVFAPGQTQQVVSIPVIGDRVDETNKAKTFCLDISNPQNVLLSNRQGIGTILDDDFARISIADSTVYEGNSGATDCVFRVMSSNPSEGSVRVHYASSDETAMAGLDYQAAEGDLVIPAGSTNATLTVRIFGDVDIEPDETFRVNLSNPAGASLGDRTTAIGTILNDDVPKVTVAPVTVWEGNEGITNAVFILHMDSPAPRDITLQYATSDQTATHGSDYYATNGSLYLPAGTTQAEVRVAVLGDRVPEPDETFLLLLSTAAPVKLPAGPTQGTILNDDVQLELVSALLTGEECQPSNRAIDPLEQVTVEVGLTNVSTLSTTNLVVRLLPDNGIVSLVGTQSYGQVRPGGAAVSRPFTFRISARCGDTVSARFLLLEGDRALGYLTNAFTLGVYKNGTFACCSMVDLAVLVADSPDPVGVGHTLTYSVTVTNLGVEPATGVVLTNKLGKGASFQNCQPTQGSWSQVGDLIVWTIGTVQPGSAVFERIDVSPQMSGWLVSYFKASSLEESADDANNLAIATTQVESAVGLSISDARVAEGDQGTTHAVFTVTLGQVMATEVRVDYASKDGSAKAREDYEPVSGTLVFPPGTLRATVSVPVQGDLLVEPDETFHIQLSNPVGVPLSTTNSAGVGTIVNDDQSIIAVDDVEIREGPPGTQVQVQFHVKVSKPNSAPIQVAFATANDSALAGRDYGATNGVLVLPPQAVEAAVGVWILGDDETESDEVFFLNLTNPRNAFLGASHGRCIIHDFELPRLRIGDVEVLEGNPGDATVAIFTVTLSAPSPQGVSVRYRTRDGTATSGIDYVPTAGILTFSPGVRTNTVRVPVLPDTVAEPDELLYLDLSEPQNALFEKNRASASATIVDDDYAPRIVGMGARLLEEGCEPENTAIDPMETVTVGFELSNSGNLSTANLTATLLAVSGVIPSPTNATQGYGRLRPGADAVTRPFTFMVDRSCGEVFDAVLRLRDGDLDLGWITNTLAVGVYTNGSYLCCSSADVGVRVVGSPEPVDRGQPVTFTVTVTNLGPAAAEGVMLTNKLAAGMSFLTVSPSQGRGANYGDVVVWEIGSLPGEASATAIIRALPQVAGVGLSLVRADSTVYDPNLDNNIAVVQTHISRPPGIAIGDAVAREGPQDTFASFEVELYPATNRAVTVRYVTADGTAVAGADYVAQSGLLTFAPFMVKTNLSIRILADTADEPEETFYVRLSEASGSIVVRGEGVGTIVDEDPPVLSIADTTVNVGTNTDVTAVLRVELSSPATNVVSVRYDTRNGSATMGTDFVDRHGTLVFPAGVCSTNLSIPIVGNTFDEAEEVFYVDLSDATNALLAKAWGTVTISDEDPAAMTISDVRIVEGDWGVTNAVFVVRLNKAILHECQVAFATEDQTAKAGSDYEPVRGVLRFPPGTSETNIVVPVLGDTVHEPTEETFRVILSDPYNATLLKSVARGTIVDDDPIPRLTIDDTEVVEGDYETNHARFAVRLDRVSSAPVDVEYATQDGGATAGQDYLNSRGTLRFAPGETTKMILVPVLGDVVFESNEDFFVTVSVGPEAGVAMLRSKGRAVIVDNDTNGAVLHGQATDALNGLPLPRVRVTAGGLEALTDSQGYYLLTNVPPGTLKADFDASLYAGEAPLRVQFLNYSTESALTVRGTRGGYIDYVNPRVQVRASETVRHDFSLSPLLNGLRFVLNWGEMPRDLDAHLLTPDSHVWYSSRGRTNAQPYANLDVDDTDSYGPETITMTQFTPGRYRYYVHNYKDEQGDTGPLTISRGIVQIYNERGLIRTVSVPQKGSGDYWDVCSVDGVTGGITVINALQARPPGNDDPGGQTHSTPSPGDPGSGGGASLAYEWHFGDGSVSREASPVKTYSSRGAYDVSLTVTDTNQVRITLTKTGFIRVGVDEGAPRLTIRRNGSQFVLEWEAGPQDAILESTASLVFPNWAPTGATPVVAEGHNSVALPLPQQGERFFRLRNGD